LVVPPADMDEEARTSWCDEKLGVGDLKGDVRMIARPIWVLREGDKVRVADAKVAGDEGAAFFVAADMGPTDLVAIDGEVGIGNGRAALGGDNWRWACGCGFAVAENAPVETCRL
jgi:hypothetical protein